MKEEEKTKEQLIREAADLHILLGILEAENQNLKNSLQTVGEEKARMDSILAGMGDGISIQGPDYIITYQNRILRDMFGEHTGEYCYRAYAQRETVCEDCPAAVTLKEGKIHTVERTISSAKGTYQMEITLSPLCNAAGEITGSIKVYRDITKRKEMESMLRSVAQGISASTGDAFFLSLAEFLATALNADYVIIAELLKDKYDMVRTLAFFDHGKISDNFEYSLAGTPCENVVKQKLRCYPRDVQSYFPDNNGLASMSVESFVGTPLMDSALNVIGIVNVMDSKPLENPDIAESILRIFAARSSSELERKQAEDRLRTAEARYRTLFEQSPDGILLIDSRGVLTDFNEAAHRQLGYTREEFTGLRISDIDPFETEDEIRASIEHALNGGRAEFEVKHRTKGGEIRTVLVITKPVLLGGEKFLHTIWRDITDHKKMEEELTKIEKLESLGVLAGGIAHDFKNLLVGILGNISLARLNISSREEANERLAEAEKACLAARGLTHQLLTFSRSGDPMKQTVSIAEILKDSCTFCLSGSDVKCEHIFAADIWPVEIDAGQIGQVFHNLIINADQAMPDGGILKINAGNVSIEAGNILPLRPGQYVRITLEDRGIGIRKEHLLKIFDPYFTTKQKGSGLGLASAYSIVKKHGGHIDVSSELGVGTVFTVYLPASPGGLAVKETPVKKTLSGGGRVLLMDDEEIVRIASVKMLEHLGYDVVFTEDGEQAVALFRQAIAEGRPFDAVILDLTVRGGMGGRETNSRLRAIDPGVRTIVFSGYSDDPIMADYRNFGFSGFLSKPCEIEELSVVLHEVLKKRD